MKSSASPSVMILGANGRFGRVAVQAFSHAGWRVIAQSRSAPAFALPATAVSLICDARDSAALLSGAGTNLQVIVNGLNPDYTRWDELVPPLAESALTAARETGALLMLPGNVYNFGKILPPVLTERTIQMANTPKAAIRIAMESRMQAAAADGVRSVVIRAGDFLGGPGPGTWLDMVIAAKLQQDTLTYPGRTDAAHAWAYLPDLARVFVAVAERRAALSRSAVFHYEGLTLNGSELHAACERAAARPLRLKKMPWWPLRIASPFAALPRSLLEMRYLWERPHRLDQSRLAELIGTVPHTPLDQVLRACLPGSMAGAGSPIAGEQRAA